MIPTRNRRTLFASIGLVLAATLLVAACDLGADTPNPPVKITATNTNLVAPGTVVTISVDAQSPPNATASSVYGIEARLCKANVPILNSADFAPTRGGNCIAHPLSAGTDAWTSIGIAPPYKTGTLTYKLGEGTDRYTMGDGTPVTITCNKATACQLVVKVQVPA
ncbi:MAG: hypothetical protein ACXWB2_21125, partial [Acidimicrobiales bacterium]